MIFIYLQAIGCLVFVICILVFGVLLRRHPSKQMAEKTAKVVHFFFFIAVVLPMVIGFSNPGLTQYDEVLDLPSLPLRPISILAGMIMMTIGLFLVTISITVLLKKGAGAPAFALSETVVSEDIFALSRNPMSLGFYLICIAIGLLAVSTFFVVWSLVVLIPVHIFFLKFFEELELEVRFGQPYLEYKQKVPFMIPSYRSTNNTN